VFTQRTHKDIHATFHRLTGTFLGLCMSPTGRGPCSGPKESPCVFSSQCHETSRNAKISEVPNSPIMSFFTQKCIFIYNFCHQMAKTMKYFNPHPPEVLISHTMALWYTIHKPRPHYVLKRSQYEYFAHISRPDWCLNVPDRSSGIVYANYCNDWLLWLTQLPTSL